MELKLLNGTYSSEEAKQLISRLIKVKTDFHISKINTKVDTEEHIKSSEQRILELERSLRNAMDLISSGTYKEIMLSAKIVLEFCPNYHAENR